MTTYLPDCTEQFSLAYNESAGGNMLLLADASSYRQFSVLPTQSTARAQRDGTDTVSNFIILRTDQIGLAEWKAGAADSLSQNT